MSEGHDLHFLEENLPASTTGGMTILGYTAEQGYLCPYPLVITRVRAILTEKRTAGLCEVRFTKGDGTILTIPAAIEFNEDNPQFIDVEIDRTLADRLAVGEYLMAVYDTDAAWLPVTSDLVVILTLARPYGP